MSLRTLSSRLVVPLIVLVVLLTVAVVTSQTPATSQAETVRAITKPTHPLPPEKDSAGVTKFSFLAYGDTRGRRDGVELQYEHSQVIDGMLAAIRRLESTPYPVRFVVQSGDAVAKGSDPTQWNKSY